LVCKLALFCGLRLNEIDKAQISWVRDGAIHIPAESLAFTSKTQSSVRTIPLAFDPLVLRGESDSIWLVPGDRKARVETGKSRAKGDYHRLQCYYASYAKILRAKFPAFFNGFQIWHKLRKEFASVMVTNYGIFATQQLGGWSSTDMINKIYGALTELPDIKKDLF
jgi:integrase